METMTQPKITGYRKLSDADGALMNEIKAKGIELEALIDRVRAHVRAQHPQRPSTPENIQTWQAEEARLLAAEPHRWIAIATTDLQTGLMALTRAVAQPGSF